MSGVLLGAGTSTASLADVLPSVTAAIGCPVRGPSVIELPAARSAVVVLVDGLGETLLLRRAGHAPFLRDLRAQADRPGASTPVVAAVLTSGFPSTTATSMGMLGTGRLPGAHGLVGLDVLDPERDVLFNELAWDPQVDPRVWQPTSTVFAEAAAAGVDVVRIGPAFFDGSGLTEAALRGGRFVAADSLERRVGAAVAATRQPGCQLVYLYWGDVDKVGHVSGSESWQWADELTQTDRWIAHLVERVGRDVLVVVTADHGMVDVPAHERVDVAHEPDLAAGVRHVGGEPRAVHLYARPGATADVLAAWRERLAGRMELLRRDDAVRAGWFGPVEPWVLPRIGDVVGSALGAFAVVDSRTARPELLRLVGLHGARSPQEQLVPLLATLGMAAAS
ncbi:MAG TPA: alkaline phosphatase family protein [Kineosporiaceae bacterium]